jgi:hypothetical protein
MIQDEKNCLDHTQSETRIQYPNGTKEITDFSIECTPSEGYAEISGFRAPQFHQLEEFFCDLIVEMEKLNFVKHD